MPGTFVDEADERELHRATRSRAADRNPLALASFRPYGESVDPGHCPTGRRVGESALSARPRNGEVQAVASPAHIVSQRDAHAAIAPTPSIPSTPPTPPTPREPGAMERDDWRNVGFMLLALYATRLAWLAYNPDSTLYWEEDYRWVAAREILSGVRQPVFDYQADNYQGGSLVQIAMITGAFALFGESLASLKLATLTFPAATLVVLYAIARMGFRPSRRRVGWHRLPHRSTPACVFCVDPNGEPWGVGAVQPRSDRDLPGAVVRSVEYTVRVGEPSAP